MPIYNHKNQILGAQIKASDGTYRWASKPPQKPVNLPNKELPLAVFNRHDYVKDGIVYLTEGTGFKLHLTAIRLNHYTIGASGGNFDSCQEQLKVALKDAGATEVRLMADGGSISNKNVLNQYQKAVERILSWGF